MTLEYIRETYGVPAEVGARIIYSGDKKPLECEITGCKGQYLRVKTDQAGGADLILHPTWEVEYISSDG